MRRRTILLRCIMLSIFILLAGCGSPSQTPTSQNYPITESKDKGYIFQNDNQVAYLNWTKDHDNKIVGQLQITDLTNSGIQSTNHSFNGVINDSNISITITGSLLTDGWAGKVITGNLDGANKVTLVFPSSNGTMNPVTFTSGTIANFNDKVAALNQSYSNLQSEKQAQAQIADQQNKLQSAIKSLSNIDKKIKDDTTALASLSFSDIIGNYSNALKQMQQNYSTLKADANVQPFTSYQLGTVQYDLGTLEYDLGTFEYIDGTLQSKNSNFQYYIKTLQDDIKSYNTAWSNYQEMGGQGSTITLDQMNSSISSAQNQISKANNSYNSVKSQADGYNKQAKDLYNTASAFVKGLKAQD